MGDIESYSYPATAVLGFSADPDFAVERAGGWVGGCGWLVVGGAGQVVDRGKITNPMPNLADMGDRLGQREAILAQARAPQNASALQAPPKCEFGSQKRLRRLDPVTHPEPYVPDGGVSASRSRKPAFLTHIAS